MGRGQLKTEKAATDHVFLGLFSLENVHELFTQLPDGGICNDNMWCECEVCEGEVCEGEVCEGEVCEGEVSTS
jgi:hypothetical protein